MNLQQEMAVGKYKEWWEPKKPKKPGGQKKERPPKVIKAEDVFSKIDVKRGPGRPSGKTSKGFSPTEQDVEDVCVMVANGTPQNIMATMIGVTVTELKKHFKKELALGKIMANARITLALYDKAKNGDVRALQFWLKNKDKWVDVSAVALTDKDGADLMNPTERTQRLANLLMANPDVAKKFGKKDKPTVH